MVGEHDLLLSGSRFLLLYDTHPAEPWVEEIKEELFLLYLPCLAWLKGD
jgi:hypothetical protein